MQNELSKWLQGVVMVLVLLNSIILIVYRERFIAVAKGIPEWWLWYAGVYLILVYVLVSVWTYFLGYERGKRK
jgi:uncharacterized membrane protein YdcZ (DUF606 family)